MTSTELEALLLTDDEVAAVALGLRRPWPARLPTVDVEVDAVLAAATRGRRSLVVRELWAPDEDGFGKSAGAAREVFGATLDGGLRCGVLVTTADLTDIPDVPVFYHFGAAPDEVWLTDVVQPGGVHCLTRSPRPDCLEVLEALLDEAARGAAAAAADTAEQWLCFVGPDEKHAVLAGHGELRRHRMLDVREDGTVVSERLDDAASAAAALLWLGVPGTGHV